ncbi:MAG: quinohemoprotein amine dehydrogenase subunit alpha, partial [Rhodospirillales bacterium]|nr:quinohemoprotein amine dehydrogenase subunit alpha [Rhodospirillales bacterium]
YTPGQGSYSGRANIRRKDTFEYRVNYQLIYENGTELQLSGKAFLYTGYEWRSTLNTADKSFEEVAALSADGNVLTGRWFETPGDEIGGDFQAVRMGAGLSKIMAVVPPYLKMDTVADISIYGNDLVGTVSLGAGVIILKVKESGPSRIVVEAKAADGAFSGARTVSVGTASATGMFAVYRKVDFIRVTPAFAVARSRGGGPGGRVVQAQFEAVAYASGTDGREGTDDDLRIGVLPAAWSLRKFDAASETMKDVVSAGSINAQGLFKPKAEDPFASGNLWVEAVVEGNGGKLTGRARLVVTPQRQNENPIR